MGNERLQLMKSKVQKVEKSENIYKIEIEKLRSELRTKDMKNSLLRSRMKRMGAEIILNYDGKQELAENGKDEKEVMVKHRKDPESPSCLTPREEKMEDDEKIVRPNQFLSAMSNHSVARKKTFSMDYGVQ